MCIEINRKEREALRKEKENFATATQIYTEFLIVFQGFIAILFFQEEIFTPYFPCLRRFRGNNKYNN